jgi:hypothetical protein
MSDIKFSNVGAGYPTFPVHDICRDLHERTRLYEIDAKFWLHKLAEFGQSGFSAATLPMMRLADDERNLRQLADAIKKQREQLTGT